LREIFPALNRGIGIHFNFTLNFNFSDKEKSFTLKTMREKTLTKLGVENEGRKLR
jgi:hypothetical protein